MRIKEIREAQGKKQKELAVALGIAPNTLSQYENGKREPDLETIKKMSDILNVSIDSLLGKSEETPTPVSESGQHINIVKIAGRDGSYKEKRLTDEQIKALQTIIDQMPEAPEDL